MAIMLGNLSLRQLQDRCGFEFPQEALDLLQNRQETVNNTPLADDAWHCFDIPFLIMFGTEKQARAFGQALAPYGSQFKTPLQVGWER